MARQSLSAQVEYEKTDYGFRLYREDSDEHIKICDHEVEDLADLI